MLDGERASHPGGHLQFVDARSVDAAADGPRRAEVEGEVVGSLDLGGGEHAPMGGVHPEVLLGRQSGRGGDEADEDQGAGRKVTGNGCCGGVQDGALGRPGRCRSTSSASLAHGLEGPDDQYALTGCGRGLTTRADDETGAALCGLRAPPSWC